MPDIGPGQKAALLEGYHATISLLPTSIRTEFLLIGGASLLILGSKRKTEDIDFAVTTAGLFAFEQAICNDSRFSKGSVGEYIYSYIGKGIEEIKVSIEFLQMGGGFAPNIKVVKPAGEGFRAGMGELVRMKGNAYMARGLDKDLEDFCFLLKKMEETGESFKGVKLEEEDLEDMGATAGERGERHSDLLKELLRKAGY